MGVIYYSITPTCINRLRILEVSIIVIVSVSVSVLVLVFVVEVLVRMIIEKLDISIFCGI